MEELKREQEMRERRNQDRDRQGDSSVSSSYSCSLCIILFCSLHRCSALILTLDSLLSILNLFCIQPSSRFDELPDDFDPSGRPGSFDDGDPQTTNLYVGNLSPKVFFLFLLGSCVVFSRHCFLNIHKVRYAHIGR